MPVTAKKMLAQACCAGEIISLSNFGTEIVRSENIPLMVYFLPLPQAIEHPVPKINKTDFYE